MSFTPFFFLIIIGVKSNKTNDNKYISFISTHSVTYYSILNELIAMYAIGVPAESRLHNTQSIQKTCAAPFVCLLCAYFKAQ